MTATYLVIFHGASIVENFTWHFTFVHLIILKESIGLGLTYDGHPNLRWGHVDIKLATNQQADSCWESCVSLHDLWRLLLYDEGADEKIDLGSLGTVHVQWWNWIKLIFNWDYEEYEYFFHAFHSTETIKLNFCSTFFYLFLIIIFIFRQLVTTCPFKIQEHEGCRYL